MKKKKEKKKKRERCFYRNLLKVRYYIYQIYTARYIVLSKANKKKSYLIFDRYVRDTSGDREDRERGF